MQGSCSITEWCCSELQTEEHMSNEHEQEQDNAMPEQVDHRTCLHDYIPLDNGAVGCTICYWVWECNEPLYGDEHD